MIMGSRSFTIMFVMIAAALLLPAEVSFAFVPSSSFSSSSWVAPRNCKSNSSHLQKVVSKANHRPAIAAGSPGTILYASNNNGNSKPVEITFPSPDEAASMGIRDWPQQFYSKSWSETIAEGAIATRYILEGKGRVTIDYYNDSGEMQRINNQRVYPGTLVEVDGEANLYWEVDDEKDGIIVLTPSYEEGTKLLLVGGFFIVFCAGLLIGSGGGF